MKYFVDSIWLENHMNDENVFIIDCRFDLFNASYGREAYNEGHIPGAFFLDLNEDFSGKRRVHGGARPLPDLSLLVKELEEIGISTGSRIVVYDHKTYSSGRAWWQLKYMGFDKVYILDGGYEDWKNLKFPVSKDIPNKGQKGKIELETVFEIYCDIDFVKNAVEDPNIILLDSREDKRYSGEFEPLYSKKGHIPGAINFHWKKNIDENGKIKDMDTIAENYSYLDKSKEIIVYCGSGIASAMNFVLLYQLGYKIRLYVGSISDWISYEENNLETD